MKRRRGEGIRSGRAKRRGAEGGGGEEKRGGEEKGERYSQNIHLYNSFRLTLSLKILFSFKQIKMILSVWRHEEISPGRSVLCCQETAAPVKEIPAAKHSSLRNKQNYLH